MHSPASSEQPALATLLEAGRTDLACFTDEELRAVGAGGDAPESRREDRLSSYSEETQRVVLATALRSLIARGMVQPPTEEQLTTGRGEVPLDLETMGDLQLVLSLRGHPSMLAFVGQQEYLGMLYGIQDGPGPGCLEEQVTPQGLHYFTLWSLDELVHTLAARADPGGLTPEQVPPGPQPGGQPPADVVESLASLTHDAMRIDAYHQRPEGNRRIRFGVLAASTGTWVAFSAFGVDPKPGAAVKVDRAGLLAAMRGVLTDADEATEAGG